MMILLHRLNGEEFALNVELIERAEATPDTVLSLRDGTRLVVRESVEELIEAMVDLNAKVLARAWRYWPPVPPEIEADPPPEATLPARTPSSPKLRLIQDKEDG
jgi:flagellar protein FlbD